MAEQVLKRHPIRGFLYGIVFGLGLAMIFVGQGWTALGTWGPFVVFLVGLILATSWGAFGPSKAPKGPEPVPVDTGEAPEPSRFDDFDAPVAEDVVDGDDAPGDATTEEPAAAGDDDRDGA